MRWLYLTIFSFSSLIADNSYHKLLDQFSETLGRNGSWEYGEIQIARTDTEIKRIETLAKNRLIKMGYTPKQAAEYSKIGIVAEDQYWIWVRDAVLFPGAIPGTYNRIIWKSGLTGPAGVVILPILKNKKIFVNVNFRHATRAWELELPRGMRKINETPEAAALRELQEETGCISHDIKKLGELAPDSGIVQGSVPVFYAKVSDTRQRHQEESEAIALNLEMSMDEIRNALSKGYWITDIKGIKTRVYCRDPYLSYALLQAMWAKII